MVREGGGAHLIQNLHFSPHELLMSLHSKALKSEEMGCEWDFGCVVHAAQGKRGCRSPDSDMHHHIPISWDADVSAQNKISKSETRWREIIRCAKGMKSPIWSALPVPLPIPVPCINDPHQKQTRKKSKRHGIRWCGRVCEILTMIRSVLQNHTTGIHLPAPMVGNASRLAYGCERGWMRGKP